MWSSLPGGGESGFWYRDESKRCGGRNDGRHLSEPLLYMQALCSPFYTRDLVLAAQCFHVVFSILQVEKGET